MLSLADMDYSATKYVVLTFIFTSK